MDYYRSVRLFVSTVLCDVAAADDKQQQHGKRNGGCAEEQGADAECRGGAGADAGAAEYCLIENQAGNLLR